MATHTDEELLPAAPTRAPSSWTPANPGPLGLAAFAATTLILSFCNSNLVSPGATAAVLGVALAYGGIVQILAGMWEFRCGNTFGAVAFSSFGGFWISFYFLIHGASLLGTHAAAGIGLYLWIWAVLTAGLLICTPPLPAIFTALFGFLLLTFIFLAIGNSGSDAGTVHIGGYLGIVTGAIACYMAVAAIAESTYGRPILPLGKPLVKKH